MASLIDLTWFKRDVFIAQLGQLEVQEDVNSYLSVNEPDLLNALLGPDLYASFLAGLVPPTPDPKWIKLRDGAEYVDICGRKRIWTGLANPSKKDSVIANYVWWNYTRSNTSWTTGSGQALPKLQNATRAAAANKMCLVWNDMVTQNLEMVQYLNQNAAEYPEWTPIQSCYRRFDIFYYWPLGYFDYPLRDCKRGDLYTRINAFNI